MNNPQTVLLLISGLGPGGAERIFNSLARELSKTHRVIECVFNLEGQVYPFVTKDNYVLTPKVAKSGFQKAFYFILRVYRLWKLKRQVRADYCISQLESSDYLNVLTRQKNERAVCLIQCSMIFNHDINGFSGWWRKKIFMPITYRNADLIVTVSTAIKKEFELYFKVQPSKVDVIFNFIDLETVKEKSFEQLDDWVADLLKEKYCFITAGRLTAQKNHMPLISVFAKLKLHHGSHFKLVLLGDGDLRKSLIDHAVENGLKVYSAWSIQPAGAEYDIYFFGFTDNPFKYFARAKWFIFPSLWEGLPLVLVEAMASGIPIISADCPTGPSDILNDSIASLDFVEEPFDAKYGVLMPMIPNTTSERIIEMWSTKILSLHRDASIRAKYLTIQEERLSQFSTPYAIAKWNTILEKL